MLDSRCLIDKIKVYCPNFDEELVLKAYDLSKYSHKSQSRSSGEPYFSHPLAVAEILIDLKLDAISVIVALLHDVIEDTDVVLEDIEKQFGKKIASLVDGVTKLTKIEHMTSKQRAAENFKKLVIATSHDIRVLIVKLADRLHNMRTINFIKEKEKRVRIAEESLTIYASLAARIGMYKIQDELQDLSFDQINSKTRHYIIDKVSEFKKKRGDLVQRIIKSIINKLSKNISNFEVHGREKTPYSIWQKMKQINVGFDQLYDIIAFRIIVKDISSCYKALGIINTNYSMIPGSFRDFISTPKDNDYKSIHLSILGPESKKIEIQIRTYDMHRTNEMGIAAHWIYKENVTKDEERQQYVWLRELVNLFEHYPSASDALEGHRIQMHDDQVFCFTPGGDIFNLPMGATVLDFAYAIHSDIGNKCISARVNDIISPLRQKLNNGDQIEIITAKDSKPSPQWLQFVVTSKAKVSIKHFVKNERNLEYSKLGKTIIDKFFASEDLRVDDDLLKKNLDKLGKKSLDELYIAIAEKTISRNEVVKALYSNYEFNKNNSIKYDIKKKTKNSQYSVPIQGLVSGMSIHFPRCCFPIPGDQIVGIINVGTGITIHNLACINVGSMSLDSDKVIDVCWKNHNDIKDDLFTVQLVLTVKNVCGSISDVTGTISAQGINISDFRIIIREVDYFEVLIDLQIHNLNELEIAIALLRMSEKIMKVSRYHV